MIYNNIVTGIFLERPNRFVAIVDIAGEHHKVHVKNTGRCRELLVRGAVVYLEDFKGRMGGRKLRYSLISVVKFTPHLSRHINMDSQVPNKVIEEALINRTLKLPNMSKLSLIKREASFQSSRFDFYVEDESGNKGYIEVKGVTLEKDGVVLFPDAPTTRGVKHINQLILARDMGFLSYVVFLVQMADVKYFTPNSKTHEDFAKALVNAQNEGVTILAYDCFVDEISITLKGRIPIIL